MSSGLREERKARALEALRAEFKKIKMAEALKLAVFRPRLFVLTSIG